MQPFHYSLKLAFLKMFKTSFLFMLVYFSTLWLRVCFRFSRKLSTEHSVTNSQQVEGHTKQVLKWSREWKPLLFNSSGFAIWFHSTQFICTRGSGCDTALLVSSIESIEGLSVRARGVHVTDLLWELRKSEIGWCWKWMVFLHATLVSLY